MGVYPRGSFDTDRDVNRGRAAAESILGLCELPKIEYQIIIYGWNWSSSLDEPLEPCIMTLFRPLFFGLVSLRLIVMPFVLFINLMKLPTTGAYCYYLSCKSYFIIPISLHYCQRKCSQNIWVGLTLWVLVPLSIVTSLYIAVGSWWYWQKVHLSYFLDYQALRLCLKN